ncbi:hypothetical protein ACNKHP_20130 [Shigella boydii]
MPAHPLASRLAEAYEEKLASAVGSLRNDSQLNTPKAILIDLIRALPVCLIILGGSPDSVDHAAQHRANCYGRSAKNWQNCGWCLACAGRYWR